MNENRTCLNLFNMFSFLSYFTFPSLSCTIEMSLYKYTFWCHPARAHVLTLCKVCKYLGMYMGGTNKCKHFFTTTND